MNENKQMLSRRQREQIPKNMTCQKCLQVGHWTYECKNPKIYLQRESASDRMVQGGSRQYNLDAPPEETNTVNRFLARVPADYGKKDKVIPSPEKPPPPPTQEEEEEVKLDSVRLPRKRRARSRSSSSSSSSNSSSSSSSGSSSSSSSSSSNSSSNSSSSSSSGSCSSSSSSSEPKQRKKKQRVRDL